MHHTTPRNIILTSLIGLFTTSTFAKPPRERTMESTHSYGRGGTFAAAFESDESYRQNPASLSGAGKDLTFQIRMVDQEAMFSEGAKDTLGDLTSLLFESPTPISILQKFTKKFGEYQYLRGQTSFGMRIYSLDLAFFAMTRNELDGRVAAAPEVNFESDSIIGWNLGYAFDFGKDLSIGVNLRPFSRFYLNTDLDFAEILTFEPLGTTPVGNLLSTKSGGGFATDIGLLYKFNPLSQIGLMIDDVGYTAVSGMPAIRTMVSLGWVTRTKQKPWHSEFSVDLKDITNPEGIHMLKMLNMGWEFGRSYFSRNNDVGLTMGLHSGWLSLGAYLDMYFGKFEIVNYGVELGEYPGQRGDRRWALGFKSSLNF